MWTRQARLRAVWIWLAAQIALSTLCGAQCISYSVQVGRGPYCGSFAGYFDAVPWGINEAGQVTGVSGPCGPPGTPFIWSGQPQVPFIPVPPGHSGGAICINSSGQFAGVKQGPIGYIGYFYQQGVFTNIDLLPGADFADVTGINESGQVCGYAQNVSTGPKRVFLWEAGVLTEIEFDIGQEHVANDINDSGQIVGWLGEAPFPPFYGEAFLWDRGKTTLLGYPKGGTNSIAKAINNLGDVCGIYGKPDNEGGFVARGFYWRDGSSIDIGILPGCTSVFPTDMNDFGQIVGYCYINSSGGPGFIWQNGPMTNITTLIPPGTGLVNVAPIAINNNGQIACQALHISNLDSYVAVLLTPIPDMPGDFNCDRAVDADDILGVIRNWHSANITADFNHDGMVNVLDLLIVIQNWTW